MKKYKSIKTIKLINFDKNQKLIRHNIKRNIIVTGNEFKDYILVDYKNTKAFVSKKLLEEVRGMDHVR